LIWADLQYGRAVET